MAALGMSLMKSLMVIFLEQAIALEKKDIDLAIACVCNAMCCRNIRPYNKLELMLILGDMQKEQRRQWKGYPPS